MINIFFNSTLIVNLQFYTDIRNLLVYFISKIIASNILISPNTNLIALDLKFIFWRCLTVLSSKVTIISLINWCFFGSLCISINGWIWFCWITKAHTSYICGWFFMQSLILFIIIFFIVSRLFFIIWLFCYWDISQYMIFWGIFWIISYFILCGGALIGPISNLNVDP